jgi:branched-chain amino acid transport system permease protein
VLFVCARNFLKSRPGRALVSVRDNQTSAAVNGVNLSLYKAMAFGVSAAYGGVAGSMLMMNRPFASDVQFGLTLAIFLIVGLVVGGAGTVSGAVPGALIYVFVPYFMSEWTTDQAGIPWGLRQASEPLFDWLETRQGGGAIAGVFFGLGLMVFVFVLPGGFIDGMRRLRARVVQVIPNPSWLRHAAATKPADPSAESDTESAPGELATST